MRYGYHTPPPANTQPEADRLARCAAPWCRTSIDLAWDAEACPCGSVVTCRYDDPVDQCDVCREARDG